MKLTLLTTLTTLAATALAAPASSSSSSSSSADATSNVAERSFFCISQWQAEQYIKRFTGILTKQGSDLGDYLTTADKLLAGNFQEVSDSINSLAGFPLGSVTTPSKQAYIAGIQHAPGNQGVETIFVTVANCKNIVWHWNFAGIGSAQYPVKGFNYFSMQNQLSLQVPWVANELQLEFNSIAWGLDTGYGFVLQNGTVLGNKGQAGCAQ